MVWGTCGKAAHVTFNASVDMTKKCIDDSKSMVGKHGSFRQTRQHFANSLPPECNNGGRLTRFRAISHRQTQLSVPSVNSTLYLPSAANIRVGNLCWSSPAAPGWTIILLRCKQHFCCQSVGREQSLSYLRMVELPTS